MACCSSTSCRNSGRTCSRCCASRWRTAIVTLSRAATSLTYPARLMLAAAMNPCPCGYAGDPTHACRCDPDRGRALPRPGVGSAARPDRHSPGGAGGAVRGAGRRAVGGAECGDPRAGRGGAASGSGPGFGSSPASSPTRTWPRATSGATVGWRSRSRSCCARAITRLGLSARAYHRVLKLARTIADLAGAAEHRRVPRERGDPVPEPRSDAPESGAHGRTALEG